MKAGRLLQPSSLGGERDLVRAPEAVGGPVPPLHFAAAALLAGAAAGGAEPPLISCATPTVGLWKLGGGSVLRSLSHPERSSRSPAVAAEQMQ